MKKAILLTIPLAMAFCAMPISNAVPLSAGSEETSVVSEVSSESSEQSAQSSEEQGFKVDDIVIDGKTIAEWKKELSDAQTRNAAIMALACFGIITLLEILKWLADRGLLNKNKLIANQNEKSIEDLNAQLEALKAENAALKELITEAVAEIKNGGQALVAAGQEVAESTMKNAEMFLQIAKDDPALVAAGTFKKMRAILEKNDEEE